MKLQELLDEVQDIFSEADAPLFAYDEKQEPWEIYLYFLYLFSNPCVIFRLIDVFSTKDADLAERFTSAVSELLKNEPMQEILVDETKGTPTWYCHFAGRGGVRPYADYSDSYVQIEYLTNRGMVRGNIKFKWDVYEKDIPGVWWTQLVDQTDPQNRIQRDYISCYVNFGVEDDQGNPLPPSEVDYLRLGLLKSYWSWWELWTGKEDAHKTFAKHKFCSSYFCKALTDEEYDQCFEQCRWTAGGIEELEALIDEYNRDDKGWSGSWNRSPLLIVVARPRVWFSDKKKAEYFDDISLYVRDNTLVEIDRLTVVLNGVPILILPNSVQCPPMSISLDNPFSLSTCIEGHRLHEVEQHVPENEMTSILTEAAKNIGQGWDSSYAGGWSKDDGVWHPTPIAWCSEFACQMFDKYTWLPKVFDCSDIHVPTLWFYYWIIYDMYHVDQDDDGCSDQISPFTEYIPEPGPFPHTCGGYEWEELADKIKPGYYVGMTYRSGYDVEDKIYHSTFFVNWVSDQSPADDSCIATFHAIGGNQGGGKITFRTFNIYNTLNPSLICQGMIDQAEVNGEDAVFWGREYNFFGIVPKGKNK